MVAAQRDEIARLNNVPGRPAIKPSGMENATQPKPPTGRGRGRKSGGKKTARRVVHEDRVIKAAAPNGARFNRLRKNFLARRGLTRFNALGSAPALERKRCAARIIGPRDYSAT